MNEGLIFCALCSEHHNLQLFREWTRVLVKSCSIILQFSSCQIFTVMRAMIILLLAIVAGHVHISAALQLVSRRILRSSIMDTTRTFKRTTALFLIDSAALDTMQVTADVATNTFFASFLARTVGTIVGNLLAAFAFKYASDVVFQKFAEKKPEPVAATVVQPSTSQISQSAWIKLLFCIMIDLGSDASFLLPGIGEIEDVAWAPVSAYLLNLLFGSNVVSTLEFVKEILPGTDILPVATFAWVMQNVFNDSPITKALGLKSAEDLTVAGEKDEKKVPVSPEMDAWDDKMRNRS